jgi:hypothetical protein
MLIHIIDHHNQIPKNNNKAIVINFIDLFFHILPDIVVSNIINDKQYIINDQIVFRVLFSNRYRSSKFKYINISL